MKTRDTMGLIVQRIPRSTCTERAVLSLSVTENTSGPANTDAYHIWAKPFVKPAGTAIQLGYRSKSWYKPLSTSKLCVCEQ